jgi:hypothetical protein
MLYAKFTPGISFNKSKDPFNPQTVTLQYMTATASAYPLGATSATFNVYFGTATLANNKVTSFSKESVKFVEVGGTALSNWGTDDSSMLDYIAGTFDLTVTNNYTD